MLQDQSHSVLVAALFSFNRIKDRYFWLGLDLLEEAHKFGFSLQH